jgi:hypothetical protein
MSTWLGWGARRIRGDSFCWHRRFAAVKRGVEDKESPPPILFTAVDRPGYPKGPSSYPTGTSVAQVGCRSFLLRRESVAAADRLEFHLFARGSRVSGCRSTTHNSPQLTIEYLRLCTGSYNSMK